LKEKGKKMKITCLVQLLIWPLFLGACASTQTAKQVRYIGYQETPGPEKSIGTIEGKDCSWSVLGYSLGSPTVRSAFSNAANQRKEGFMPGQVGETTGSRLKAIKNVSVEDDGFNVWVLGRRCMVVVGEGFQ
jgi:hypothetical protein